jgi:hypothetical protein
VPTYYGGIGLAVTVDGAATFRSIGQVIQLYPSTGDWQAYNSAPTTKNPENVGGGYGTLVLADNDGNYVSNPPADPANTFFYLLYPDTDFNYAQDGNPQICQYFCLAVARASYVSVMNAVTTQTTAATVASLFTKYTLTGGVATWTQPGDSGYGDQSVESGSFTALMPDQGGALASVIYDTVAGEYLMVFMASDDETINDEGICLRTSKDLIHWSPEATDPPEIPNPPTCLRYFAPANDRTYVYPTLVGEGGNQLVGGASPFVFFQNFQELDNDAGDHDFPSWTDSELDYIPVNVTVEYPRRNPFCRSIDCF